MRIRRGALLGWLLAVGAIVFGHPYAPFWQNGTGPAVHYQPVAWPSEPADPRNCGATCGDWKPYTRFRNSINDPRVQDPSNGGTAPQNYVNVSSSCSDKSQPSIYYYLHKDAVDADKDVLMFRWRVEQPAHNYATGPSAGNFGSSNPWSSALWTVLFDVDGSGYRSLAAHLNGSSGSPAEAIDTLAGIWGETPAQSLDYINDPRVHLLGHNPTAVIGPGNKILNFQSSLTPVESWPNGAAETSWDYGTTRAKKIITSPCTEYFIDYQIPVAMLDATSVGGPKITRDTPISMLFCTANGLNNPFQKDCAINRTWGATSTLPAPFGDYLSFNKDEAYQQPIVSAVTAQPPNTCPGTYKLTARVQDALALTGGVVDTSVKAVEFYYWRDRNDDGEATAADTGSVWTRITPTAMRGGQSLNTWMADWDASGLPKGKYLIGVQAVDDNTALDDGMAASGVDNRTFSYLSGTAQNEIYIAGAWEVGQQTAFPAHSPALNPSGAEDWYGNPSVTGNQVALVGTAINACGIAPTITLGAAPASVAGGASVGFTVTVANPSTNTSAITIDSLAALLPTGFSYVSSTSGGATSADPVVSGQQLTWTLGAPLSVSAGANATLTFNATAGADAGTYNATASSVTSFGSLTSAPVSIVVDAARLSVSTIPSAYSVPADGATPLTFTLNYANDSGVAVTSASITNALPAGTTFVSCTGGSTCGLSGGDVTFTLGSLPGASSGSASFTIVVPSSYSTSSLTSSATLSATAPDSSTVTAMASTRVAVTGLAASAAFRLTKTASSVSVAPGANLTFTLVYENYGGTSASGVVLTDTLPAGISYVSCSDGCSQNSGTVTWNIGTVAAGASGTRTVTVAVSNPFTTVNPAINNASISWSGGGPITAQASVGVTGQACSVYYFGNTTANVGFDGTHRTAAVSPVPVSGDTGTKVTATAPVSGAAFLEVLRFYQDPQTQNDVPFNGDITTNIYIDRANGQGLNIRATVYDYDSATGAKTQLAQNTSLFNGSAKGLLTFAVTPSGTLAKGHRLLWIYEARSSHNSQTVQVEFQFGGTVANGISGGTTFANSNAQYCVTPPANLKLSSSVDTASIVENTTPTLKYTLRYANLGSAQATNLSLVGALPSGFTNCQYSTNDSTWSACSSAGASPPSHTFSIASLAGGGSGTVYVRGTVPMNTSGPATLTSTSMLVSDQTSQVSASASTLVSAAGGGGTPELSLNLLANRSSATPGQNVTYTATVINTGDGAASNVVVGNILPSSAYYTYLSCTGGCVNAAGTLTWPTIATLAAGASQSYTYTMTVGTSGLPAGVTSVADDVSASGDGGLAATSNGVTVTLNGNPALESTFTPSPASGLAPGGLVTYTLAVQNTGAASASGVGVSATIPAYSSFVSTPTGTFDAVNNRVVFDIGTLASEANSSVSFIARVNTPLPSGTTSLTSHAGLSASNSALQTLIATATATAAPLLFISNDAPSSIPLPSAVATAASSGTTLFVDRSDRFVLGQLIQVNNEIAAITALGPRAISVDSPLNVPSGSPVYGAATLTVSYRNDGNSDASAVTVTETLPAGFAYYSAEPSASSSPIAGNSGTIEWSVGTLNAGVGGTVRVLAFPSGATGSFTSTAVIAAANATTQTANAATVIGGLSATKTTATPVLSAGGEATYSIVTSNSLASSVLVDITDILPEGFSYQNGSTLIGGLNVEPTFAGDDDHHARPIWSGVSIPALGTTTITFKANVGSSAGAAAYQNEVIVDAPASVAMLGFDALATTQEDVTVLSATEGIVNGYVFRRFDSGTASFDAETDVPLAGVRVEIHKPAYDCNSGVDCYVAYTDSAGWFERVVPADDWIVSVIAGSGALDSAWIQVAGSNHNTVAVAAQAIVTDHNGYRAAGAMHLVTANAGSGGSIGPASSSVEEGNTTSFTVTPGPGYVASVSGCGGSLSGNTFTTAPITSACTVDATFALANYTVTATAGAGGSITPASTSVTHGSTTSFTVTPSTGASIASVTGCGGTLAGTSYTTAPITGNCSVAATFTTSGPAIATPPPARINARSLFTAVPLSLAPAAIDGNGAPIPVTLVNGPLQLVPGRHTITWRAEDTFGRIVTVEQQLDIWPMVSVGQDVVLDYGASASFDVLLNGEAPVYPYTIAFTVGGDGGLGTKHTLASGFVTFESGVEKSVRFDTLPQPGSPLDHHLTVALDPTENVGERAHLAILLRATNFAPRVSILASQADRLGTLIAKNDGMVTLHVIVADPNAADSHTFQWAYPSGAFVDISADGFDLSFDPARLAAGLLSFGVVATDNGNPPLSGAIQTMLALRDSAPLLGSGDSNGNGIPDNIEGWSDSGNGIPAYLNRITARNVLPENAPVSDRYLIESETGIRLRVGAAAQLHGDGGARLGSATVPTTIPVDEIDNVGGYFSFEAHELHAPGSKVRFVIPQRAPIPMHPFYRLWDQQAGRWITFVEDASNMLESSVGEPGICPPANSELYSRGLTPGHLCVRITIQDGGANDLDRQSNGSILKTGGVGARPQVIVTGKSQGSGAGGGGSTNGAWIMLLALLTLLKRNRRAPSVLVLAGSLLSFGAFAQSDADRPDPQRGWLFGANAMFVRGSVDAGEMDRRIARQGYQTETTLSGRSRMGKMVFGGYRWQHFALEAAYVDLGELTTEVRGTTPISDEYLLAIGRSHPQSGAGPQFSALGYLPLGERVEAFGRAGVFYWRSNMSAQGYSRYRGVDDHSFDPALGLGLSYRMSARWTVAAQWAEYRLAGERISSLSLGVSYGYRRGTDE